MNRLEHLLTIVAEECAEIARRASKANRFGLDEVQPGQPYTNARRLLGEVFDLLAVLDMLEEMGVLPTVPPHEAQKAVADKKAKVEQFLAYSQQLGTLEGA